MAAMTRVREQVQLGDLGIAFKGTKMGITRALIIEIEGSRLERERKADLLAGRMRDALDGWEGVRAGRPQKIAELRIRGLEGSITSKEVREALASKRGALPERSALRKCADRPGEGETMWARLPLVAAKAASVKTLAVG